MRLELGLQQKMSQQMVVTLQLQQAIKLLTLNHQELVDAVSAEMMENPTLEEVPGTKVQEMGDEERRVQNVAEQVQQETIEARNGAEDNGTDWGRILEEYAKSEPRGSGAAGRVDELPPIENSLQTSENLTEHMLWQLSMVQCTPDEERAAKAIIHNLDHRGWLVDATLESIAAELHLDMEDVEGGHMIVLALDPVGCGARNLGECLYAQARVRWPEDPTFEPILKEHMGSLESRSYHAISQALGIDLEDVVEYHKMIQTLEPWPGRQYTDSPPQYISPDVAVIKVGDRWQIVQNEDGLPRLRVSPYYRQILQNGLSSKDDKKYIKERLESADFLIKSIYKRQRTIHRVVESILVRQKDFFDEGAEKLKPLILKEIADEIGVHESTVSRVTTNKYLQCPHGIFELKYFFNAGIQRNHGEDLAGEAVRQKIKKLIAKEDPKSPLSDQALVDMLADDNIKIARRTVAKYREAIGIAPSVQRKKLF